MATGLRVLLLSAVLAALPGCASVRSWFHHSSPPPPASADDDNAPPPRVVEPQVARRQISVPKIRSRNVELGLNYGVLSIEDFGTHPAYGIVAAYHITEDFFFQADLGGLPARVNGEVGRDGSSRDQ